MQQFKSFRAELESYRIKNRLVEVHKESGGLVFAADPIEAALGVGGERTPDWPIAYVVGEAKLRQRFSHGTE